jgi:hypothetical protein
MRLGSGRKEGRKEGGREGRKEGGKEGRKEGGQISEVDKRRRGKMRNEMRILKKRKRKKKKKKKRILLTNVFFFCSFSKFSLLFDCFNFKI